MPAETLPFAMVSTPLNVASNTQCACVITPGNEAYAVVQTSTNGGTTYSNATTPRLYRSEVTETLTSLAANTRVRVNFYGGCGRLTVDMTASTP